MAQPGGSNSLSAAWLYAKVERNRPSEVNPTMLHDASRLLNTHSDALSRLVLITNSPELLWGQGPIKDKPMLQLHVVLYTPQ